MFIEALLMIAKKLKQPKCLSIDDWINKYSMSIQWSVIHQKKKKGIPTHHIIWMDLENIMPSERSQSQKTTYYVISFIWNVQNRQIYRKYICGPWLVWLSGLSAGLQTKRSLVWFPVRAHAWVAGQVPSWGSARTTDRCFSPSISPSLPLSLKINIYNLKKKRRKCISGCLGLGKGGFEENGKWILMSTGVLWGECMICKLDFDKNVKNSL